MHRRDFLDPRRLASSAGQVLAAIGEIKQIPSNSNDSNITLIRYARPAMGTVFEVVLPFGHGVASSIVHDALDLIDELEEQLTIYRETSEVSTLNRSAFNEASSVSPELFGLLQDAKQISELTKGAFDVTAGAIVHSWGFVRGPKRVPSDLERKNALAQSGWKHLELQSSTGRCMVRFGAAGLSINLGSIGKGYALDRVGEFFAEQIPHQPILLHGGKSSVLAIGLPPGHQRGWSVSIEHPWNSNATLATVYLIDRAMATSAATYKHLVHEGKKLGHILDPRTGWPAQGISSATAIAPTAALADALSTAFYIMGIDKTVEFCNQHPEVGAILLPEGAQQPIMINVKAA